MDKSSLSSVSSKTSPYSPTSSPEGKGCEPSPFSLIKDLAEVINYKKFLGVLQSAYGSVDSNDPQDKLLNKLIENGNLNVYYPSTQHCFGRFLGVKDVEIPEFVQKLNFKKACEEDAKNVSISCPPVKQLLKSVEEMKDILHWNKNTFTYSINTPAKGRRGSESKDNKHAVEPRKAPIKCVISSEDEFIEDGELREEESESDQCSLGAVDSHRKISITKKEPSTSIDTKLSIETVPIDRAMKHKLGEVIKEGLLDSVLPYVVPKHVPSSMGARKLVSITEVKRTSVLGCDSSSVKCSQMIGKKVFTEEKSGVANNHDSEVQIHVSDEVKNAKRHYICSRKLLIEKSAYFAGVTSGRNLEEMDISVHCDLDVFDWLIRWIKSSENSPESHPIIDTSNVVPILVSSVFLQMEPLVCACLEFLKENLNEIIHKSSNISSINDSIWASKSSGRGALMQQCKLISWDECTMPHKKAVEALNRGLQDIRSNETLMGGVVVLLAGDF